MRRVTGVVDFSAAAVFSVRQRRPFNFYQMLSIKLYLDLDTSNWISGGMRCVGRGVEGGHEHGRSAVEADSG